MKDELQQKLYDKYPKLFAQKSLPMNITCMCYGVCVGDGWYNIMEVLCSRIQGYIDRKQQKNPEFHQVEFTQVKEKFGGLRVYTNGHDEVVDFLISFATGMAARTCEDCGNPGKNRSYNGWYIAHCDTCSAEYQKKRGEKEDKHDENEEEAA